MTSKTDTSNLESQKTGKSFFEKFSLWLGLLGSIITILLTIINANTKIQIDRREEDLKVLEMKLRERTTGIEESKERVERYKWVLGLFPTLNGQNEKEKNFTLNLIRLALTKDEAEQLFTGLQNSSDTSLQSIGQNVITVIQNEPIALLISQMNAEKSEIRKSAVAKLEQDYSSSSQAITLALRQYDSEKFVALSPSGIINGLYFLSSTDPASWNKDNVKNANEVINKLNIMSLGPQTKAALTKLDNLLKQIEAK
jgi:hypothetical protein